MIDIRSLRGDYALLEWFIKSRSLDGNDFYQNLTTLLDLDQKLRQSQAQSQKIVAIRNQIAKQVGILKSKNEPCDELLRELNNSKKEEEKQVGRTKELKQEFNECLLNIPNIPLADVPLGSNEQGNVEIRRVGTPRVFSFQAKDHAELGKDLGMMHFEQAVRLAGSRFVLLSKSLARMERALMNFMLDLHESKGYVEYSVPVLLREQALINTAQLPKFTDDLFKTTDDRWLISTTEIPLTNLVADLILEDKELPLRYVAPSLCFRSEAGSSGKDTTGMLRQHQFLKVELVSVVSAENSQGELEYMLSCAEDILKLLEIPYRVVLLCTGDMGFSAAKTYDIEVWLPAQNTYREIASCSNCTDFQARRMHARVKKGDKVNNLLHTLNGSGLAVGRTLIALLENYQQEDGSIIIPKALRPYMNNEELISLA